MVILASLPRAISYEATKKIIEQMEKCICKIKIDQSQGTGFFCKIPFPTNFQLLPVLITNSHVISKNLLYQNDARITLEIKEEDNIKELCLNDRLKYINEEYDITIMEIKKEDNILNYLELDDNIMYSIFEDDKIYMKFVDSTVYALQYSEGVLSVSYGIIERIYEDKKYFFNHKCCTSFGAGGSPILNGYNNKVIGIHTRGAKKNYNIGTFLNQAIKEFIQQNDYNDFYLKKFNNKYNCFNSLKLTFSKTLISDILFWLKSNISNFLNFALSKIFISDILLLFNINSFNSLNSILHKSSKPASPRPFHLKSNLSIL